MPGIIVLTGTTAVGKTDISIPLAEHLGAEIVNADSRQIYRELRIGTAKPSPEQISRVRHHFIDEKSISDRWTAGDFSREGRARINEIISRGRLPIVVGGSMLYIRALLDGFYPDVLDGAADYASLREEWDRRGAAAMYGELEQVDPALASETHAKDHHRILRGLAVYRSFGRSLSELRRQEANPIDQSFVLWFLHADRVETYDRVNRRVESMVEAGLIDEVRSLFMQGLDDSNCNALCTHGYREVFPYLRGEITRGQMIEDIQKSVRHYVKRQLTWWRRDTRAVWLERVFSESAQQVAERLVSLLH